MYNIDLNVYQELSSAVSSFVIKAIGAGAVPPTLGEVLDTIFGGKGLVNIFLFGIAPGVAVVMIAYGGFQRIMSADNPQAVKQADQVIFWAVVGYFAVLVGWV